MRRKGSLQELINPGSEYGWSTFAFAGTDTLAALARGEPEFRAVVRQTFRDFFAGILPRRD